jgi:hypothetical protein
MNALLELLGRRVFSGAADAPVLGCEPGDVL